MKRNSKPKKKNVELLLNFLDKNFKKEKYSNDNKVDNKEYYCQK
jgi:hypothetical protein